MARCIRTRWSQTFDLPYDVGEATLVVDVQGTQAVHNEVLVNAANLGHLRSNPESEYIASDHSIPHGVLRRGTNTIEIIVGFQDEHHHDYDDILIRNVRIIADQHPTGTGNTEPPFWRNIAAALTAKGWTTTRIPDFPWQQ